MTFKTIFTFFVCFVLLLACQPVATMAPSKPLTVKELPSKTSSSLLWEISGNNLKQPSYIFGTLHVISKDKFFMPPILRQTFSETDLLVLEIDLSDPNFQKESLRYVDMPNNEMLTDLLEPNDLTLVENFFADSLELGLSVFNTWKPLWLSNLTLNKVLPSESMSYEEEFMAMAKAQNKHLMALETVQFQMQMFDKVPFDEQAKILVENIEEYDRVRTVYDKLEEVYLTKNIDKLYEFSLAEMRDFKRFEDILIIQRNKNWIPKITKYIKGTSSFIAVGAGHLGGQNGVIRLLQQKGYKVRPIELL